MTMRRTRVAVVYILVVVLLTTVGCSKPDNTWTVFNYSFYQDVDFKHYPSALAVNLFSLNLASDYPDLVHYEVVGHSVQGKPLVALTITNLKSGSHLERPALLVIGQQHAREPIGSQVALYWLNDILSSYGKNEIITHLLDTRTIYVLPQVNPDGNDIFLKSDNRLRTNLRPSDLDNDGFFDEDLREDLGVHSYERWLVHLSSRWLRGGHPFRAGWNRRGPSGEFLNGAFARFEGYVDIDGLKIRQQDNDRDGKINEDYYHGVDLNRNWDFYWLEGSTNKYAETYKGPAPWSEPETRAMRDYILARPNIVTAVDLHSGVDMLLYPWSATDEPPPDEELLQIISRTATSLTEAPHTQGGLGLYLAYGGAKDWLYAQGILALTAEVFQGADVFSYYPVGAGVYRVYRSLAHLFNPEPERIVDTAERWGSLLTYMLSILPSQCVSSVAVLENIVEVTLQNTGYLHAPIISIEAAVDGKPVTATWAHKSGETVLALPLKLGQTAKLRLTFGQVLSMGDRPIPIQELTLSRTAEGVKIEAGNEYRGASPSTLFLYGYAAPKYPWGAGQWYLKTRR